jgi:hypothetical protein
VRAWESHVTLETFAQDPLVAARRFRGNTPGVKPRWSPALIARHVWPENTCTATGHELHVDFVGRTEHTDDDVYTMVRLDDGNTPDAVGLRLSTLPTRRVGGSRVGCSWSGVSLGVSLRRRGGSVERRAGCAAPPSGTLPAVGFTCVFNGVASAQRPAHVSFHIAGAAHQRACARPATAQHPARPAAGPEHADVRPEPAAPHQSLLRPHLRLV